MNEYEEGHNIPECDMGGNETERKYILIERGLYWGTNSCGYTGLKTEAGLYSRKEAEARISSDVKMIEEQNAPLFSPSCDDGTKLVYLFNLLSVEEGKLSAERAKVRELEAHNAVLREALEFYADYKNNWETHHYAELNLVSLDLGDKARKALSLTPTDAAELARKKDCWRPIDTAPMDEWVIGCESGKYVIMTIRNKTFWCYHDQAGEHVWSPTHWMPLPEQPIEAARAAGVEVEG